MSQAQPAISAGARVRVMQTDSMILKKLAGLTGAVVGTDAGGGCVVRFDNGRPPALVPISCLMPLSKVRKTYTTQVACPRCRTQQNDRGRDAQYRCHNCGALFDSDPDEGGDYSNDPTKRVERGG